MRVFRDVDLIPGDGAREALKQNLAFELDGAQDLEIDHEIKFLSLFAIRYKAKFGPSSFRSKLFVLLSPSLILILAIAGAAALFWILAVVRHI